MITRSPVRSMSLLHTTAWAALLVVAIGTSSVLGARESAGVVVWDTGSRSDGTADIENRAGWKAVPPDLMTLEADPLKASSDPGYYGREYSFEGDAVVENDYVTAVFKAGKEVAAVYSRTDPSRAILQLIPRPSRTQPTSISRCAILQNTGDEAALEVSWSAGGTDKGLSAVFSFDKTRVVEIRPGEAMKGVGLQGLVEYGVVPGFVGDDLILSPGAYPSADTLCVPSENLFLGLLKGENRVLAMTWPSGQQQMRLRLSGEEQGRRFIDSIDFDNDGQSVYLALLEAPGIWHREELKPSYLEKDVTIDWKRPFPAKWVTQLDESGVKATYTFRESKGQIWRGVPGMYTYPVRLDGDDAVYHLSKKVLPRGESIIYFLEGRGTPAGVATPVDILKATLGRQACVPILDVAGRKLRTHHRRGAEGIRRACTCGCTAAIEAVFKAGEEVERRQYVEGAVGDMVYFVRVHMQRLDEYRAFANDLIGFLHEAADASPGLKPYLDRVEQIAQQVPQYYETQKVNIKSLEYTDELARRTVALTRRKDPGNLRACLELGKEWRGMGGAQDGLLAQYHVTTRHLFQEAGYGCVTQPEALAVAHEIRRRCRQCLRNADGYEIWPDY